MVPTLGLLCLMFAASVSHTAFPPVQLMALSAHAQERQPAGVFAAVHGGAAVPVAMHAWALLLHSVWTNQLRPPTVIVPSDSGMFAQMSPISPLFWSYQARGGPATVARPTCESVTVSMISWVWTSVTLPR